TQLIGLQLLQLELRLVKNPSRSFRPLKSAENFWQISTSCSFRVPFALDWNKQKLHHLEEALPEAPPATATTIVRNAYTRRVAEQQEVACLIRLGKNCLKLSRHSCKHKEGQSVSTYVLKVKAYLDQMERLGYLVPLVLGVNLILTSLSKDYDQFVQNYNMHGMGKTIPELHAMLNLVEKGIPKKALAVLAIRQGRIQKPKRKHEAWERTRVKARMYDTGCGTHICNTIQGLRGIQKLNKDYGAILVFKDNLFYLNAIPRDGIFEIDMHNHVSNECSIYTCSNKKSKHNLDSTFLWHCRLGHINKKCTAKLLHDGLLKSIDDESFDACVSCISGKMARKPFTHASERANDLLGLIHSDVCGLFRTTSREGGEYLSQEFLDHLRSRGIISQLTPSYTPHHNGVSERRNQTLLGMVRSMMSLTTLPMSFWGYALESAARILNIVPTKKVDTTPYEIWHGKVPNLSYLKETTGYYFYYPPENKIFVAWYAEFFENSLISQEASGSTVDFDEIQRQGAQPSENTSKHQPEIEHEDVEPQTNVNLIHPESDKWLKAMNAEMQSMRDNQVWNLVLLPPNCKTIGSKWLCAKLEGRDVEALENVIEDEPHFFTEIVDNDLRGRGGSMVGSGGGWLAKCLIMSNKDCGRGGLVVRGGKSSSESKNRLVEEPFGNRWAETSFDRDEAGRGLTRQQPRTLIRAVLLDVLADFLSLFDIGMIKVEMGGKGRFLKFKIRYVLYTDHPVLPVPCVEWNRPSILKGTGGL
ncbi:retrotransposon protein, putative, ty1-copia subclass, partial [Tanacetum coccineum]